MASLMAQMGGAAGGAGGDPSALGGAAGPDGNIDMAKMDEMLAKLKEGAAGGGAMDVDSAEPEDEGEDSEPPALI